MSIQIIRDFPGGNIEKAGEINDTVLLRQELRDTVGNWFYFCFDAVFDRPGTWRFQFLNGAAVPARGVCVSFDGGGSWEWLGMKGVKRDAPGDSFEYEFDGTRGNRVRFCSGMQYLQSDLETFLARHAGDPRLKKSVLTHSRQGRPVELLHIGPGTGPARARLLFTSRHHCCEMMATHVMEGLLEFFLTEPEPFEIYAVPFADKDGVENGDQGKNRYPHDHARDYGSAPVYPEVAAIMDLVNEWKPDFVMDLHCPWLYGGDSNEQIYFVGPRSPRMDSETRRFADLLEKRTPPDVPFSMKYYIPFGSQWNTDANYTGGMTLAQWAASFDFVRCSTSMEIPFANAGDVTLTGDSVRRFGKALAQSILKYFE